MIKWCSKLKTLSKKKKKFICFKLNPQTLLAISEIMKELLMQNSEFGHHSIENKRLLVVSLGTGGAKYAVKYTAPAVSKWSKLDWVLSRPITKGGSPLYDIYSDAGADMIDIHVSTLFQALRCEDKYKYLRIQVCTKLFYLFVT